MTMFLTIFTVVLLTLGCTVEGKQCPKVITEPNFNVTRYAGLWYEVYRNFVFFEFGQRCVNATYTLNSNGTVGVWNQGTGFFGKYYSINGTAQVKNVSEPGALAVTFPKIGNSSGDYNVISTNYVDYSLVYSCMSYDILSFTFRTEYIWVLSRTKNITATTVAQLKTVLNNMGATVAGLGPTPQNC